MTIYRYWGYDIYAIGEANVAHLIGTLVKVKVGDKLEVYI